MKHKPAPPEEQAELVDNLGQFDFVRAGGVHGLDPVVVGLRNEGVGRVHLENFGFGFRRRHGRFAEATAGFQIHIPSGTVGLMKVTLSASSLEVAARIMVGLAPLWAVPPHIQPASIP